MTINSQVDILMAVGFIIQWIFSSKALRLYPLLPHIIKRPQSQISVVEIRIPVKYGHIAAKLWGTGKERPILALHGWQDNAGSWDPLIPMIIKNRPIMAIDFPGHGLSSAFPPGMMYYFWEMPRFILHIKEYFKWDKISLLGHSMGAIAAMRYACIFADDVDFYIAIDGLIYDEYDEELVIDKYPKLMQRGLIAQDLFFKVPPAYTIEEIKRKWHIATNKSVGLENVHFLTKRGVKPSKNEPNKYCFTRDIRLKYVLFNPESRFFVLSLAKRLKCPTLCIKARDSSFSVDQLSEDICDVVRKNNPKFIYKVIPGTHHVHLNNPELVASLILDFINEFDIYA